MKKNLIIAACAALATIVISSCTSTKSVTDSMEDYQIKTFADQPFLGETTISDYDYEAGNSFLVSRYAPKDTGACSSFRCGNFHARNLDWFVKDYALLVTHVKADSAKHRYASVGIVSSNPFISREMIASGIVPDTVKTGDKQMTNWRNIFPVFTTDGVNECGVCVNTNIVLHEEGVRENYVPCTGKPDQPKTSFVSLPRFVLDNCSSCDDAIKKLAALSVTQAYQGPLASEDSHLMISDSTKTVVVEWRNNEMCYVEYKKENNFHSENGMPCIMTNFFSTVLNENTKNGVTDMNSFYEQNPYAMGVERYQTLCNGFDQAGSSLETAEKQIEKVLYSKFYDFKNNWKTENAGYYHKAANGGFEYATDGTKTTWAKAGSYDEAMGKFYNSDYTKNEFKDYGGIDHQMKLLDSGKETDKWYTELTSVFDIANKTLYVMPQEGWYNHSYTKFTVE